jgi:ferredoxin-type protein NapF
MRLLTRLAALVLAAVLAVPLVPWPWVSMFVASASPFVSVCGAVAARVVGAAALVGLPVLVIALISRRWFCRWACPVGLMSETLAVWHGRLVRPWFPRGSAEGQSYPVSKGIGRCPPVGEWIALATFGGAILGYPLFLWLDPLALLVGFLGAWHGPVTVAGLVAAVGLPIVAVISILFPHAWCARICPLGAVQDLLALPRQWLRRGQSPARALASEPAAGAAGNPTRRMLLAAGLGAVGGLAARKVHGSTPPPIRPPGAVEEERFTGLCIRCGGCVRVCPSRIIRPDLARHGVAGLLAPVVTFDEKYCLEDCRLCVEACPSGALRRLSLEEKRRHVMGLARVDLDVCVLACGKDCSACMRACPYQAVSATEPTDGSPSEPRVDLSKCVGCGACEVECPTDPARRAIRVYPPGAIV